MKFELRQPAVKKEAIYKTLYLERTLADHIDKIAIENRTSFNNVVVSMIEYLQKRTDLFLKQ